MHLPQGVGSIIILALALAFPLAIAQVGGGGPAVDPPMEAGMLEVAQPDAGTGEAEA